MASRKSSAEIVSDPKIRSFMKESSKLFSAAYLIRGINNPGVASIALTRCRTKSS